MNAVSNFSSELHCHALCTSHDPSDHRVSDQVPYDQSFDYSNPQNPILMASSTSSIFYMLKPILLIFLLMKLLTPLLCSALLSLVNAPHPFIDIHVG